MLNRVIEKGTPKCHQYWPREKDDRMSFEEVGLAVENISLTPGQHYNISTLRWQHTSSDTWLDIGFRLTNTDTEESRDVLHFHYTTWPDFGVPSCPDTFLEFLGAVRESGSLDSSEGPAVVHCSAGIGRSGSFILVDSCLLEAETEGPETVNIKQRLLDMRTFRMGLIQTEDQLKFSYQAIIEVNQTGCCSQPIRDIIYRERDSSTSSASCPAWRPPWPRRLARVRTRMCRLHSRHPGRRVWGGRPARTESWLATSSWRTSWRPMGESRELPTPAPPTAAQ